LVKHELFSINAFAASFVVLPHGAVKLGEALPAEDLAAVTSMVAVQTTTAPIRVCAVAHRVAALVLFDRLVAPWARLGVLLDPLRGAVRLLLRSVELCARLASVHRHAVLNARLLTAVGTREPLVVANDALAGAAAVGAVNERRVVLERHLEATIVETFETRRRMLLQNTVGDDRGARDAFDLAAPFARLGRRVRSEASAA
jgi:hypothetical protein